MSEENEQPVADTKPKRARKPRAKKAAKPRVKRAAKTGDTKSVVDSKYLEKYVTSDVKTASGKRKSLDVNDRLASKLRGLSPKDLYAVFKDNGIELPKGVKEKNAGLQRMSLGNMLRARVKRGEKIVIGGQSVASL